MLDDKNVIIYLKNTENKITRKVNQIKSRFVAKKNLLISRSEKYVSIFLMFFLLDVNSNS